MNSTLTSALPNEWLVDLMEAVLVVSEQRTLTAILQQIVDLARPLLQADYAAVGLYSATNQMQMFVYSGIASEAAGRISHSPVGLGLLAIMDEDGKRPFSISRIADDPRAVGFPPYHPPMNALLAVPLVAHGVSVGRLYLTRESDIPFSAQEQMLATHFAAHVAITIHNGRLLEAAQQEQHAMSMQNCRLHKLSDELLAVPSLLDLRTAMAATCAIARQILDVTYGAVLVMTDRRLETFVEDKDDDAVSLPLWLETLREIGRANMALPMQIVTRFPAASFTDDTLFVPILAEGQVVGYYFLTGRTGDDGFTNADYELIEMLAAHTAVIIQNAHAYEEVSRLAITEERARIGMDLHDGVIQSIYAVGLILESARMSAPDGVVESDQLMVQAIAELNGTIRDIRNFILDLRPHRFDGNLKQALARLVREFQANTMIAVAVDIGVTLTESLSSEASLAVFLTTQEALANIARHARATEVTLSARRLAGMVVLRITDNGHGFDMQTLSQTTVGHGLSNMRSRTEELRGELEIKSVLGEGTAVSFRLPCLI